MKKQFFAVVTALGCMASMAALQVSAYNINDVIETNDGNAAIVLISGIKNAVLVETDGTALTEGMCNTIDGFLSLSTWEDWYASEGNSVWQSFNTTLQPGDNAYVISFEGEDYEADGEVLIRAGRSLSLEYDWITDVSLIDDYLTSQIDAIDSIILYTEAEISEEAIPELADFSLIRRQSSGETYYGYQCYFPADLTRLEAIGADAADGSPYEEYLYIEQFCNQLYTSYCDAYALTSVEIICSYPETPDTSLLSSVSVWNSAGDQNADGTVDAADAADVLAVAAQVGAGTAASEDVVTSVCDVNADGAVDAADAAAILQYAAVLGAGREVSWMDILG